ncbi:MAG: PQQ-binding-like beta-propeller repeat protein [Pyrinomonadaceae bacterium]
MKANKHFFVVLVTMLGVAVSFVTNIHAQYSSGKKQAGYHLLNKIEVGGEGGWDALITDPDAQRLYVSHGTKVVVIDTSTDKVVGEIPNTNGVHGIAIARKLGRGFTSNGRDNTVTIFDLKTLKNLGTVKTDKNPDIIIFDSSSNRVFSFNGGSNDATVIEAADGKVAGTVALGGKPEFAVSNGKGTVYVNIEDKSEVVAIDAKTLEVKTHWTLAPAGEEPTGLAMDTKTNRLFIVCGNKKMVVMDAATGKVITDLPTGDGTDGAEFDPGAKLAFSSNGEGTLTVVHEDSKDKFTVVENVTTQPRARTMAVDTKTHKVYLPTAQFGPAPAATTAQPRPRAPMLPGSFVILVYGK